MHRVAKGDHQAQGRNNGNRGHDHGQEDQGQSAEKEIEQPENKDHGQGRGHGHLGEHFHADGAFGHGQARDMILFIAAEFFDLALQGCVDFVAEQFVRQRQVQTQGLAVLGDHLPLKQRIGQGLVPDGQSFFARGRRTGHEPLKTDGPRSVLGHVLGHGRRDHVGLNHSGGAAGLVRILPTQGRGEAGQLKHPGQGLRGEDPVRMAFVDHPDHDGFAQGKPAFAFLVENAHRGALFEHVLRVRIHGDPGEKRTRTQREQSDGHGDPPVTPDGKFNDAGFE